MFAKLMLAVAGLALLVAGSACSRRAEAEGCDHAAPECLPDDLTLTDTMDVVYPAETFPGKVVVLNFWATWCGPCKDEIPAFNRVFTEYANRGVLIFGILQDYKIESDAELLNFQSDYEMTYPTVWMDQAIARRFGVPSQIPTTWIYDRQGRRVLNRTGPMHEQELRAQLDRLLSRS